MSEYQLHEVPPYQWTEISDTGLTVKWEGDGKGRLVVDQDSDGQAVLVLVSAEPRAWRVRQSA